MFLRSRGWPLALVVVLTAWIGMTGCARCEEDTDGDGFVNCDNIITDPDPTPTTSVRIWGGDDQSAEAGTTLRNAITVAVLDNAGNGANPPITATFEVRSGGGGMIGGTTPTKVNVTTNAQGLASASWKLGPTLGDQTVRVTFSGRTNFLDFKAIAHGPAAQLLKIRGEGQTAEPGKPVAIPPTVRLTDFDGRPVPNAQIAFSDGTFTDVAGTNRQGEASMPIPWVLGTSPGIYPMRATYLDGSGSVLGNPATFTATAVPVTATSMSKVTGDAQIAIRFTAVGERPAVRLVDQFGNAVQGIVVTFSRVENAGQFADSVQTTDPSGIATLGTWSLGDAGTYQVVATAAGSGITGSPATFTATAVHPTGIPAQLVLVSGNLQTGEVDVRLPNRLVVKVLDVHGQPVSGQPVLLRPVTGSGLIDNGSGIPVNPPITDANGIAQSGFWRLGKAAGLQYGSISLPLTPGVEAIGFQAIATPGTTQRLVKVAGDGNSAPAGTAIPNQSIPLVKVEDQFGNPVPGVTVNFSVGNGSGTIGAPTSPMTGAGGTARPGGWTLSSAPGQNTLLATAVPLAGTTITPVSVTFTATGTQPSPVSR